MCHERQYSKTMERALSHWALWFAHPQSEPEVPRMSGPPRVRILAVTAVAAALAAASLAAAIHAQAAVPPTTGAGWSLAFSDDFGGAAGNGVSGHWRYTTGTQYPTGPAHFGTDEVETVTSNPDNVALDGNGNLRITALNNGGNWTSG